MYATCASVLTDLQFKWPEGKRDERRDVQKVSKRHGENEALEWI